jgi:hypothetical protein
MGYMSAKEVSNTSPLISSSPSFEKASQFVQKYRTEIVIGVALLTLACMFGGMHGQFAGISAHPQAFALGLALTGALSVAGYFIHRKIDAKYSAPLIGIMALGVLGLGMAGMGSHLNLLGFGVGVGLVSLLAIQAIKMANERKKTSEKEQTPNATPETLPQAVVPLNIPLTNVPEFNAMRELAQKINRWATATEVTCTRSVERGYTPDSSAPQLFVKRPTEEANHTNSPYEELAYLLSKKLELNCVPPTMFVPGKDPFILQGAIDVAPTSADQDPESAQRALFLNIIAGKRDGHIYNSVTDKHNNIWEIDNEGVGYLGSDSWMFGRFRSLTLDPKLIASLSRFKESDLDEVFEDFSSRHRDVGVPMDNITRNFNNLQLALKSARRVADLDKFYKTTLGRRQ